MTTALVLIDIQDSFKHRPYWSARQVPAFTDATNRLIEGAKAKGWPIVQVLHVEEKGAFSMDSGHVKPWDDLADYTPALVVHKNWHSALAGTALHPWLVSKGISKLVIAGIRTEQCCETTTRHASDSGFEVDYVTEAMLTFDMTNRQGQHFTAEQITERTTLVLDQRFARVCTVSEALA